MLENSTLGTFCLNSYGNKTYDVVESVVGRGKAVRGKFKGSKNECGGEKYTKSWKLV